jgi:hypothetical protein
VNDRGAQERPGHHDTSGEQERRAWGTHAREYKSRLRRRPPGRPSTRPVAAGRFGKEHASRWRARLACARGGARGCGDERF